MCRYEKMKSLLSVLSNKKYVIDDKLFRKYFDIVVSKFIIISKFTPFRWQHSLKRSFRFNYSL